MVRECVIGLVLGLVIAPVTGCSLVLDFSERAIPIDAAIDAPYSQAECDYLEPNDSIVAAMPITPAETGTAAICAGAGEDRDFYRFTVPAGTASVVVSIAFRSSPTGDLDLKLLTPSGTMLSQSRGFVDDETITCPSAASSCQSLAAGDYVIEVLPALVGATNRYALSLTITP